MTERPIVHSATGSTWSKKVHKYIEKIGNKYIYPTTEKVKTSAKNSVDTASKNVQYASLKVKNAGNHATAIRNGKAATSQTSSDRETVLKAKVSNVVRPVKNSVNTLTNTAKASAKSGLVKAHNVATEPIRNAQYNRLQSKNSSQRERNIRNGNKAKKMIDSRTTGVVVKSLYEKKPLSYYNADLNPAATAVAKIRASAKRAKLQKKS